MTPEFDYEKAMARIPRWLLALAVIGTVICLAKFGVSIATSFLLGAIAAWFNFKLVERVAIRITQTDQEVRKSSARWLFIQFAALALGVFVIIHFSGFSLPAAFGGFFTCPAAALLEILYELIALKH